MLTLFAYLWLIIIVTSQTFYSCKPSKDLDEVWEDGWNKKLGYYCDGEWPFYAGGFPPLSNTVKLNTYWQISDCLSLNTFNESIFCDEWYLTEYNNNKDFDSTNLHYEYCKCITFNDDNTYCNSWACRDIDNLSSNMSSLYTTSICGTIKYKENVFNASCFDDFKQDILNCFCINSAESNNFCWEWYCEEWEENDDKNGYEMDHAGLFGCSEPGGIYNNDTCNEWYGYLVDDDERKDSHCWCNDINSMTHNNNLFCSKWSCKIEGIFDLRLNQRFEMFWLSFILWVLLFGLFGTYLFFRFVPIYLSNRSYNKRFWVYYCLYWFIFAFTSITHGGITCFTLYWVLTWIFISVCYICRFRIYGKHFISLINSNDDNQDQKDTIMLDDTTKKDVQYSTFQDTK